MPERMRKVEYIGEKRRGISRIRDNAPRIDKKINVLK